MGCLPLLPYSAYPAGLDAAGVVKQLPADTNEELAKLITQIVCHHLPAWREELIDTQVSGPRVRVHMSFPSALIVP